MAKAESSRAKKDNFLITYFKETRAELRKVHWPSREEARTLTMVVLGVTIIMALFLGLLDNIFDRLLKGIVHANLFAIGITVLMIVGIFVVGRIITRED